MEGIAVRVVLTGSVGHVIGQDFLTMILNVQMGSFSATDNNSSLDAREGHAGSPPLVTYHILYLPVCCSQFSGAWRTLRRWTRSCWTHLFHVVGPHNGLDGSRIHWRTVSRCRRSQPRSGLDSRRETSGTITACHGRARERVVSFMFLPLGAAKSVSC
jgi:hypothetical protein